MDRHAGPGIGNGIDGGWGKGGMGRGEVLGKGGKKKKMMMMDGWGGIGRERKRERERELKRKGVRSERMDIYLSEGTYLYLLYNFEYEYLSGQNRSGPTHYSLSLD